MTAAISHLTILSENNFALEHFYAGFFHMRRVETDGPLGDPVLSDGRISLVLRPRIAGYRAQLDQFGITVDDLAETRARIGKFDPKAAWMERPAGHVYAAACSHDPGGTVFALSQGNGRAADSSTRPPRRIDHIAMRAIEAERVAEFYATVFGFRELDRPSEAKNFYLSDGNITLVIIPWRMSDFLGTGISSRGLDHIGFRVESIDALKADVAAATARNYRFQPGNVVVGRGREGGTRLEMIRRTCPLGRYHFADSDGLILDLVE